MVMIFCSSDYTIHLNQRSFQFERLLTNRSMYKLSPNKTHIEHLQVLRIGNLKVLVSAGADGVDVVDGSGRPVEFQAAVKPNWATTVLHMISSGSGRLVYGNTTGRTLMSIEEYSLPQLIGMLPGADRRSLAWNITSALAAIKRAVGDKLTPFDLLQWDAAGSPKLAPLARNSSLMPNSTIVKKLFSKSTK
mmetsp:Transcript_77594/g.224392  ORF Transcript_77594/g.224392 Transcript_77594/m.224392 type:complete len:191 (-) Transcript_77594:116-688(-)